MLRSHKISLVPNQAQAVYFAKGRGRFQLGWNLTAAVWNDELAAQQRGVMQRAIAATEKQKARGGRVEAWREEGAGRGRKTAVKPVSAKQEVKA